MLIQQIEEKDKRMHEIKASYERKLANLSKHINTIEMERDEKIDDLSSKPNTKQTEAKIRQVKDEYEKKLGSLRSDFKKYQEIEKAHNRMIMQHDKQREHMNLLQQEILNMKRNTVSYKQLYTYTKF